MSSAARAQLLWMVCGVACSTSTETPSTKDTGPGDPTNTETYTSSSTTPSTVPTWSGTATLTRRESGRH